jgi:hypothetical protein
MIEKLNAEKTNIKSILTPLEAKVEEYGSIAETFLDY